MVNYVEARKEVDPLADVLLFVSVDLDQKYDVIDGMNQIVQTAKYNGPPEENIDTLTPLLANEGNLFRLSISSGPQLAFYSWS